MSTYTPDRWVIVKIKSDEYGSIFKIFASWSGGYLDSNSWKLSSGNLPDFKDGSFIVFPQESGSEYRCHEDAERMSGYMASVFTGLKNSVEKVGGTIEVIEYKDYHDQKTNL